MPPLAYPDGMQMLRLLGTHVLLTAFTLLLFAEPALAQDTGAPPVPALSRSPHAAIGYGVMVLLLVLVITVSIMPSKRGHQD